MPDIKRILVASDMSDSSALAETRAARLCRRFGLTALELVNVQDTGFASTLSQMLGNTEKKSREIVSAQVIADFEPVRQRFSSEFGIAVSVTVLFGRPSVEIAKYAEESDADLIVTGAKHPGLGKHLFLGNTPDRLLHGSPVPLLIVRQDPKGHYQNVLIPVDFSENSKYAASVAMKIMLPASRKTFLYAYDVPNEGLMHYASISADLIGKFRAEAKRKAEDEMADLIASFDDDNRISRVVRYGSARQVIEDYANTGHPDLIVMGKQGRSALENLFLGSTTRNTVNTTSCDILVVPLKTK